MRIFIDTNIVLDFFLHREEYKAAELLFELAYQFKITAIVSSASMTDIYYQCRKVVGREKALECILKLFKIVNVADTFGFSVFRAAEMYWKDFEDSVQYVVAQDYDVDYIITRDKTGFNQSEIPVKTPVDFLSLLLDHE